jgi:hypothetical protein
MSTCPLGGRLMGGRTRGLVRRGELSCHCLLRETPAGLVLVDTGFGLRDVHDARSRLSSFFLMLVARIFAMEKDRAERVANQERLRELARVSPELPAEYLSALQRRVSYPSAKPAPSVVALPA